MVDIQATLAMHKIKAVAVPVIKDRYIVHHSNLGGCIFIHLDPSDVEVALRILGDMPGVEGALTREEAVSTFKLYPSRLGDIVVVGEGDVVFGNASEVAMPAGLRSHGSLHECPVPLIGYNGDFGDFSFEENKDIGRYVFERVLT
jgi:phosphonoacetate hydrolase